jgi:hypothetical protein
MVGISVGKSLLLANQEIVVPTINLGSESGGSCTYNPPSTTCTASFVKNFTITNYTSGVPFAELVSGTSVTVVRNGSNNSGNFTFSFNGTAGGLFSTYRIGINVGGTNYYSSNFMISLSRFNSINEQLKVWFNFDAGSVYNNKNIVPSDFFISGVSGQQTSANPVSASLGSHHYRSEANSAGSGLLANTVNYTGLVSLTQTVSFWLKYSNQTAGTLEVFTILYLFGSELTLSLTKNSTLPWPLQYSFGGTRSAVSGFTITNDTWTHVTVTLQPNTIRFYKNGSFVTSIARTISTKSSPYQLMHTGSSSFTHTRTKAMDSFGMWDKVLSDAEIAYLYNSGVGRNLDNLGNP